MKRQLHPKVVSRTLGIALITLLLSLSSVQVWAFDVGHSRVTSAPGQPLVVDVVLTNLNEGDIQTLKVQIAPATSWAEAGLVPPVALDSLRLAVVTDSNASSRVVRISSAAVSERSVIDIVLSVSTGSASRLVQASIIVPAPPVIRAAGGQAITVMRGDTLIGIANRFPVQGADLYQLLWALYQANPKAFISENMNLLRAGAALAIPDAATVRAVDPRLARERYLAHVQSFRNMRGGIGAVPANSTLTSPSPVQSQGKVEPEAVPPRPAPAEDKVTLSSATADVSKDQQVSEAKATAEQRARVDQLTQNVEALRSATAVTGTAGATGAAGATGVASAGAESGSATQSTAPGTAAALDGAGVIAGAGTATGSAAGSAAGTTAGTTAGSAAGTATGSAAGAAAGTATGTAAGAAGTQSSSANGSAPAASSEVKAGSELGRGTPSTVAQPTSPGFGVSAMPGSSISAPSGPSSAASVTQIEPDAVERAKRWVVDNVVASIAIVLALLALILAWALRSPAERAESKVDPEPITDSPQAQAFKEKLQGIDLSLDSEGRPSESSKQPDSKV